MRSYLALMFAVRVWAHDAPANVTVHVQLREENAMMRALVRVPLEVVRDVEFPALNGGYLDVAALQPRLAGLAKIWVADSLHLYEDGQPVSASRVVRTQISLESDRSFASFAAAEQRLREPLPANDEKLFWKQVFFDVELAIPLQHPGAALSIRPAFAGLGEKVQTVLHYGAQTFLLNGEQDRFPLEPRWWEAAWLFVRMGFLHILAGMDHLLFVLSLAIPVRRIRPLVGVVTAFTVAHSITLIGSALGMAPGGLWFPPFVELAIAVSIVLLALGNIVGWGGDRGLALVFFFGLVHGFGFSFALRESLQFAGGHWAAALFTFNLGVELGQLLALLVIVPLLSLCFRYLVEERIGVIVLSALVAHTGWHWMWERGDVLARYQITAPEWSVALLLRWVLAAMLLAAACWGWSSWRASRQR